MNTDNELKLKKMKFLENLVDFSKQAKNTLMEKHSEKNFDECLGTFENITTNIHKFYDLVSLRWTIKNANDPIPGEPIRIAIFGTGAVHIQYDFGDIEQFLHVPFEYFTSAFDNALRSLSKEEEKIEITVTRRQLNEIKKRELI